MPRGDRMGPEGRGPMTGRRMGYCAGHDVAGFGHGMNYGRGMSYGHGAGFGHGMNYGRGMSYGHGAGYGHRMGYGYKPGYGHGMGYGRGAGRYGMGRGRGMGPCWSGVYQDQVGYAPMPTYVPNPEDEKRHLEEFAKQLEADLESIKERIQELEETEE